MRGYRITASGAPTLLRWIAALAILSTLASCSFFFPSHGETGSVHIVVSDPYAASRTILPPAADLEVNSFWLSGDGPGSNILSERSITAAGDTYTQLVVGLWMFTVLGKNGADSASPTVTYGTVSIYVEANGLVSDTVMMAPIHGDGFYSAAIGWAGVTGVTVSSVSLVPTSGQATPPAPTQSLVGTTLTLSGSGVTTGMYDFSVVLTRGSVEVPLHESLQVFAGLTSTKTTTLTGTDFECPPAAPTGLTAVATMGTIHLSWSCAADTEAGFIVDRQVDSGAWQLLDNTIAANAVAYSDADVGFDHVYSYRVRSFNAIGESANSPQFNFWPAGIGVVDIPQITLALGGVPQKLDYDQSFTATVTPSQAVDSYWWYLDGAQTGPSGAGETSWAVGSQSPGVHRVAVVAAKNSVRYSAEAVFLVTKTKAITSFGFVSPAVTGVIDETSKQIRLVVPAGTSLSNLIATFVTTGARVEVGSTPQVSGETVNSFFETSPTYTVWAADDSWVNYSVTVISPATVATTAPSGYGATTASGGGSYSSNGGSAILKAGICWSTSENPTTLDAKTEDTVGAAWTSSMTGLSPGTTYNVRAYATNGAGTAYGNQLSFTTLGPPAVVSTSIEDINATSATVSGVVSISGGTTVTARGFCWSTEHDPTIDDVADFDAAFGSGTGSFSGTITGLVVATVYYVRAYATNDQGTAYGEEIPFRTVGWAGPAGGLVFYDKGAYSDGWRYLEAAPGDQSTGIQWYNGTSDTQASGIAVGTGKANTERIVDVQTTATNYAAILCQDLRLNGFGDWFLPSNDELSRMYLNLRAQGLGGLSGLYWSSTEDNVSLAWIMNIVGGGLYSAGKANSASVRAARVW